MEPEGPRDTSRRGKQSHKGTRRGPCLKVAANGFTQGPRSREGNPP